jgi:hypothetical protein
VTDNDVYTTDTTLATGLQKLGFKFSGAANYTGAPALTVTINSNKSYCVSATSKSGKSFKLTSTSSGVTAGALCVAADAP